jgi:hypothetical protein
MQFLFGKPVLPVRPRANGARPLFILGAYPSALHVKWHPPGFKRPIQAVAVDNEPEPFWNGTDEIERVGRWKAEVGYKEGWGTVEGCGSLNGPSGDWVLKNVLCPLKCSYREAWITDCLNTYFESTGAAKRMDSNEVKEVLRELGIAPRKHRPHPSEAEIVRLGKSEHMERLRSELSAAKPKVVVSLGNAALRVLQALADPGSSKLSKLNPGKDYGSELPLIIGGHHCVWLPLAHPAAPKVYQERHAGWVRARA